ncbi:hypothetical protein Tco_0842343 [Tanacetum coccineum]|uniref:Retrovirus-related Pol polyprotein from transposon TNT 1-94 n=1 Tax=Tanacetum coccineum TaxID=301880 RepID=A0ABQ5AZ10_9ASTR
MFGTIPPIPPPLVTNPGNTGSPNRVDTFPNDNTNNTGTNNVTLNVVAKDLLQLLDSRGGSHVTNVPAFNWSPEDRRLANQDKILKSIIISCLPNDVMKSVIKCTTAQSMWNDLVLAHEGPSNTRVTKIAGLRLKFNVFNPLKGKKVQGTFTRMKILLNDPENKGVSC